MGTLVTDQGVEPASFRDRNARVFRDRGLIYRGLGNQALKEWQALEKTSFFRTFTTKGSIVGTERIDPLEAQVPQELATEWSCILRHDTIPVISYPYEWSFGMLKDAALLHLDLLRAALNENMILKDSSAYNIQWRGASPVFIDVGSFEVLRKGEPWVGYRQFCQMFLYPLMLQAYKEIPYHPWLRGCLDGIDPESFQKMMSVRDLLRGGVLLHVYLQAKAQARYAATTVDIKKGLKDVGFERAMIANNVGNLRELVNGLTWSRSKSEWSHYAAEHSYSDEEYDRKKIFVSDAVRTRRWNLAWDLGCNTGTFSRIAAGNADYVVSMDADQLAVEYFYQELKKEGNKAILPLVGNIADPSPNLGWRGLERRSLHERKAPDLTLCLALIHHIVISANIPLREFIDWLAGLGTALIIEFVAKSDPMVKKLLLNKIDNYDDYDVGYFERCLSGSFVIQRREELKSGARILYFARNRREAGL